MKIRRLFFIAIILVLIFGANSHVTQAQEGLVFEGQIAYVGQDGNIWVRRGDGDNALPVTYDAGENRRYASPRWSPDGLKLAYCQIANGAGDAGQLYVSRNGEWQPFLLAEDVFCKDVPGGSFSWSPDGTQIAYARTFVYNPQSTTTLWDPYHGLWVVNVITGELSEQITPPAANPLINPQWSPDGGRIKLYEIAYIEGLGVFRIWDKETGALANWVGIAGELFPGYSSWSPDGSQIVFDEVTYAGFPGAGLIVASTDGEQVTKIYSNPNRVATYPIWSPDGKYIAYQSGRYGQVSSRLMLSTIDGSEQLEIYSSETPVTPLAWSPSGSQLLFAASEEDHFNLLVYDLEQGTSVQVGVTSVIGGDWSQIPPMTERDGDMGLEVVPDIQLTNDLLLYIAPDYRLVLYDPVTEAEVSLSESMAVAGFYPSPSRQSLIYNRRLISLDFRDDGNLVVQTTPLPATPVSDKISWLPDESRFAYDDQYGRVWIADKEGGFIEVPGASSSPQWSFDGQWLSYCSEEGDLWTIGPNSPPQEVAKGVDCEPLWSPSQDVLAFTQNYTDELDTHHIFIFDTEAVTSTLVMEESRLEGWSLDGKYLAVRRPEKPTTSLSSYIIIMINPESEEQLFVGGFQEEDPGEKLWIPFQDGYLFGPFHINGEMTSASRVAETLLDASAEGDRLLVGIGEGDQITVACLDALSGEKEPLQTFYMAGLPDNERPGIWGKLSPDGNWAALAAYNQGSFTNLISSCDQTQQVPIEADGLVEVGDFSGNSRWYVHRQNLPEGGASLVLYDLELEEIATLPTMNASPVYWIHSPTTSKAPETFQITGKVTTESGAPIQGVLILIDGTPLTESGADGTYTITGLQADTYTLSPEKEGATFTPEAYNISLPKDAGGNDFISNQPDIITSVETITPIATITSTATSAPIAIASPSVSELISSLPSISIEDAWLVDQDILLVVVCGGLLVMFLLLFALYLVARLLRGHRDKDILKDPNAIILEPSEVEVREWLREGATLIKSGELAKGDAKLRQVIEFAPQNASAWMWLGWSAAQKGDRRTAEQCFKRAKTLNHPKADKALIWLQRKP